MKKLKKKKSEFSWAEYYKRRKKHLLDYKKRRYEEDVEYREKMKERSRQRYDMIRERKPRVDRQIFTDRRGREYVTIGKLSVAIHRDVTAIRRYHRDGVIPLPKRFDSRGWRLYSLDQVKILKNAFQDLDNFKLRNLKSVSEVVRKQWR